jgi:hypothetical protein
MFTRLYGFETVTTRYSNVFSHARSRPPYRELFFIKALHL